MKLDQQTLMILGLVVLAVLNVPWSYLWSIAKSFKLPSFGGNADDELLIVSLKEVKKELHCICEAIRDLGDKS